MGNLWLRFTGIVASIGLLVSLSSLVLLMAAGQTLPATRQLAYVRQVERYSDILLLDIDRQMQVNLSDTPGSSENARHAVLYSTDTAMAWSPDGSQIAYLARWTKFAVLLLSLRGQITSLADEAPPLAGITWSPDGQTIGYGGWVETQVNDLFSLTLDQSGQPQVLYATLADERQLQWSPDHANSRYAFMSGKGLYILSSDETTPRLITGEEILPVAYDWSPDGTQLALAANRFEPQVIYTDLYLIDLASGTTTSLGIRNPAGTLYDVTWSPDGTKIAFVSDHRDTRLSLFVWDIGSPFPRSLTGRTFTSIVAPDWSPDSRTLAFVGFTTRSVNPGLFMIDEDGNNLRSVPGAAGYVWSPRWRPARS